VREHGAGLAVLAEKGWVDGVAAVTLTDDYRAHREVEHRLQMVDDQQTHRTAHDEDGFARIAAFMGTASRPSRYDLNDRSPGCRG
jgi:[glutamine synthetase] adenylyltransferase / [glutamine synthetase]-adenylyl-L-tyrosine phosphorylase